MDVIFQNEEAQVRLFSTPESWRKHAEGLEDAHWQVGLYWTQLQSDEGLFHLAAESLKDHKPLWSVRMGIDQFGAARLLGGTVFHDKSPSSFDLFAETIDVLKISFDDEVHDLIWSLSPPFVPTKKSPAALSEQNMRRLAAEEFTPELLDQLTLLTQSAWTRAGFFPPAENTLRAALTEMIAHPRASSWTASSENRIQAYIIAIDGKLALWGAYSPRRDQKLIGYLLSLAQARVEEEPIHSAVPREAERANFWHSTARRIKDAFPVKQVQLMLLSTQGPAFEAQSTLRIEEEGDQMTCYSYDENKTCTGWTRISKKSLTLENWKLQWNLPSQTAALELDWSISGEYLSLERIHFLRRHLLTQGCLGMVAAHADGGNIKRLENLGFIRINSLYGWRTPKLPDLMG